MASIYDVKPAFQNVLRPLVGRLAGAGVTPNQVTVAALILCHGAAIAELLVPGHAVLLLLPPVLFVRMALNAIDGMLAREHGPVTALGTLLNELGDVLGDFVLYLPLALRVGAPLAVTALVLIVACAALGELAGVAGVQIGASRRYDGPLGKSDRAFVFGALGLALGVGAPTGTWLTVLLWALVGAALLTVINRARNALVEVQGDVA